MLIRTLALASVALLWTAPSNAATFYVAANGTFNTACSRSTPCLTFNDALAVATPGDAIFCITTPDASAIKIEKSISIDCSAARAPIRDFASLGAGGANVSIAINIAASSDDPLRTVRLRGLTIDGAVRGNTAPSGRSLDHGIEIQAARAVHIEDCVIANFIKAGIYDHRTGGHSGLFIKDTVISGSGGAGILAASAAVSGTVLDNVTSENNAFGIAVATGNNVVINRSVFSGNSATGVEGDAGSHIIIDGSKISHNNVGVQSSSSVRVSNTDIAFNNTAFNGPAATMGSNRFSGNGSMGTPLMPISGAPADVGP